MMVCLRFQAPGRIARFDSPGERVWPMFQMLKGPSLLEELDYNIELPDFEGPLDLHLVKKHVALHLMGRPVGVGFMAFLKVSDPALCNRVIKVISIDGGAGTDERCPVQQKRELARKRTNGERTAMSSA